ncbi:hypothetical protein PDIG_71070 [Penicillium digitatum PHI26]|uniref:Uncharacterized protein n=2 Tax=Penicillium digitatum TaxID=36651 RepID=K9FEX4_PEND2|nr:hypothetical protein PDIP_80390 [Penicillium digitatum Pd1]EKV06224.1 hypothetical protein PDIP_80390 [Penicillium digitatum Pd1]EKV07759.1 hypothetical protein PDIG_71070 [Penicillium digitatum PHI26]
MFFWPVDWPSRVRKEPYVRAVSYNKDESDGGIVPWVSSHRCCRRVDDRSSFGCLIIP